MLINFKLGLAWYLILDRQNFRASQICQRLLRDDHEGDVDLWWQWRRGGPDRRILTGLVKPREMERKLFETY